MSANFNIDNFLQNAMDEFEMQPRISSFDAVLNKLAKKKRRRFLILFFFGFGFSLITALVLLPNYFREKTPSKSERAAVSMEITSEIKNRNIKTAIPKLAIRKLVTAKANTSVVSTHSTPKNLTTSKHAPPAAEHNEVAKLPNDFMAPPPVMAASEVNLKTTDVSPQEQIKTSLANSLDSTKLNTQLSAVDSLSTTDSIIVVVDHNTDQNLASESEPLLKKKRRFMIGINANPQYNSLLLRENKNRAASYNNSSVVNFSTLYLKTRKEQNTFNFNYSFGIKFGYQINDKWEVWINGGLQRIMYDEKLYNFSSSQGNTLTGTGGFLNNSAATANGNERGYRNVFSYRYYGLSLTRLFTPNPFLKLKVDAGLTANQLFASSTTYVESPNTYYYDYSSFSSQSSKWIYTTYVNMGLIKELGNRFQCRLSPGLFYSPKSMFKNNYVIKQNSYGFEVEGAVIFKLF